ncbi:MAG TPA: sigma-70 family RNA polymerase sigma factor [Geothrix sp.]
MIQRAATGDSDAFGALLLNAALMLRRSRVRVHDMERAMPLALGAFDERGHHPEPDHLPEWQVEAQAHAVVEQQELRGCLIRALDKLPVSNRIVFVLRDLEDWATDDIARHLELRPGAVRQRLHRSRLHLQARLHTFVLGDRP